MKNIKRYLTVLAFIFTSAVLNAQSGGGAAVPFLAMDMGARYFGMAGAATAFGNDVTAMTFYNPAAAGQIEALQISANIYESTLDMKYQYAAFAVPINFFSLFGNFAPVAGLSVYVFDKGDIEDYGSTRSLGNDMAVILSFGEHIGTTLWNFQGNASRLEHYLGLNAKFITSSLPKPESGTADAEGYAVDLGYKGVIDDYFGLALSARNIGSGMKYIKEEDPLPSTVSVGLFATLVDIKNMRWDLSGDYIGYIKDKEGRIRLGTEMSFSDSLAVRFGAKLLEENDTEYTLGFGVKFQGFELDFGTVLNPQLGGGSLYQAGISYKLGPGKEEDEDKTSKKKKFVDYKDYGERRQKQAEQNARLNPDPILYQ